MGKTREHRLEAGVGFLQLCTWWLNQKSPFYTVICSILCLWSMMFWRLLQDVKMPKKTFAIPQHLLEVQCILFFLSALSVGILRFEELAQSLDVLMLVCKSKLPWSHIDHQLFIEASSVQRLHSLWNPWLHTFPTGISYLSSYVSTSEKFLTTMAHLLNTKTFSHLFGNLWPCQSTIRV